MSEGEYEPFQLDQPEIDDAIIAKLDYINAERKLVLSRALIEQTAKYLQQVRELVKDVNQFWAYSFLQHVVIKELCSAKLDIQALSYLSNVELKQNTSDPRPFELVFHFAENPFFTNTTLSKKYTLPNGEAEKEGDELIKAMQDWQPVDLESHAISIDWKEGQNLLEKYPRNAGSEGDFEGDRGSFFHFFTEKEDTDSVGILLQADILPEVYNYYIGDGENCETTYSELDEDELDEETGDEEEIDLEAEEENAKKRKRT